MVIPALIAAAIAHAQGFYCAHSLAWSLKNPGNLRDARGNPQEFETIDAGWSALLVHILDHRHMVLGAYLAVKVFQCAPDCGRSTELVCKLTGYGAGTTMEFS